MRSTLRARLDLHCHTDRSDGRWPPEGLLPRAAARGLDVLAPTDHDLPPPVPPGTHTVAGRAIRVLAATEVSGAWQGREQHLLVYFPGEMPVDFAAWLTHRAAARARRYDEAIRRLGVDLPPADADARAGRRALTRHHLARALVDAGLVPTLSGAFQRIAPVMPLIDLDFREAIGIARAAGGFPSWAHPALDDAQAWITTFVDAGLRGLEALRPRAPRPTRNGLARLAKRHRLLLTGGSDWHGWGDGELGHYAVSGEHAAAFLAALG